LTRAEDLLSCFNPLAGKSELRPLVVKAMPSKGSRSRFRPIRFFDLSTPKTNSQK
jgi:hypothetical protein